MNKDKYSPDADTPEGRGFNSAEHEAMLIVLSRGPAPLPAPEPMSAADKTELTRLVARAVELNAVVKKATAEFDVVKKGLRAAMKKAGRNIEFDGASQFWAHQKSGMQARLTYPSLTPVMNYDELRSLVGTLIFNKITRPVAFELVPEGVNKALEAEAVTESQLAQCLHDPLPREPSVYIEKISKKGHTNGKGKTSDTD